MVPWDNSLGTNFKKFRKNEPEKDIESILKNVYDHWQSIHTFPNQQWLVESTSIGRSQVDDENKTIFFIFSTNFLLV